MNTIKNNEYKLGKYNIDCQCSALSCNYYLHGFCNLTGGATSVNVLSTCQCLLRFNFIRKTSFSLSSSPGYSLFETIFSGWRESLVRVEWTGI